MQERCGGLQRRETLRESLNRFMKFDDVVNLILEKVKRDHCLRKADQAYGKKTSAYKSGAVVRCRKGKIWKKK